jgi:hypothetical protein
LTTVLDHLAVTAPNLEVGAAWVKQALGVEVQPGGAHARMGTHNALLRLGDSCYLEVIAADPAASRPERPRWFALDEITEDSPPRLAAWVARTDDIQVASASCNGLLGEVEPMSRGALSWLITIPADGSLSMGGAAPALIQWHQQTHPAAALKDSGCRLAGLEIFHPEQSRVRDVFTAIGLSPIPTLHDLARDKHPYLVAHIDTPSGRRTLLSP